MDFTDRPLKDILMDRLSIILVHPQPPGPKLADLIRELQTTATYDEIQAHIKLILQVNGLSSPSETVVTNCEGALRLLGDTPLDNGATPEQHRKATSEVPSEEHNPAEVIPDPERPALAKLTDEELTHFLHKTVATLTGMVAFRDDTIFELHQRGYNISTLAADARLSRQQIERIIRATKARHQTTK